jgi:ABC-2 type transport system ATP-binding protein
MIEIDHLTVEFGSLRAVDDLCLSIPAGELFAFLGPNGAGKTTTIKALTGLLQPQRGTLKLGGIDIARDPVGAKRKLGYVPDVAVFYDKLTPLEFMSFIGDIFELERALVRRVTAELFDKFHLHPFSTRRIENLSHGTKQRLAIAAALLHEPEVLVIDEPMVGLDPLHARIIKDELHARSRAGVTVLMSTHLLHIAEQVADRIGIMSRGRLIACGTMGQLREGRRAAELESLFLEMIQEEGETEVRG